MRLVIGTAIVAGIALCLYAVAVVPALQRRAKVRPIAAQIDALVPKSEPLYAVDPDYQPFLFYIRSRLVYVSRVDDLPLSARYVLIQPEKEREVLESRAMGAVARAADPHRDRLPKTNGDPGEGRRRESIRAAMSVQVDRAIRRAMTLAGEAGNSASSGGALDPPRVAVTQLSFDNSGETAFVSTLTNFRHAFHQHK